MHSFSFVNENPKERWRVWLPLLCSGVLVMGMVLGFNLHDTLRNKRDLSTVITRNDRLDELIDLVNEKYVDTINDNLLYRDAITGILKSLDPHTVYIPAEDLENINDDLEGSFSGIGIEFSIIRDTLTVTSVFDNGPANKAGIEIGDQFIKVKDSLIAGVGISNERISHLLKGPAQSTVPVMVRPHNHPVRIVTITRGAIPTYSIDASIMLDDQTGYIKINRFSATTTSEFKDALKKLQESGARQLILDLRDNPGGYLETATAIAGTFLDNDKLVVYTQGGHSPKVEYRSKENGSFDKGKLAILIDENSASASEILAGAIQDWDRGIIIGRRSYGKGLVQQQYDLPDGAALRLTIAKYYTPSGRCIQRSFAHGKEAYAEDYEKRFEDGELTGYDTTRSHDTIPYYTANHRLVYSGGGIKPDVYVPYDTGRFSGNFKHTLYSAELKTAILDYYVSNKATLKFAGINEFATSFNGIEEVAGNYLALLEPGARKLAANALSSPVNKKYFGLQIKARLARFLYHDNGFYSISVKDDEVVNKALEVLYSAQYSKLIGRK